MSKRRDRATEDILANCVRNDRTGCLIWQGQLHKKGYGVIKVNGIDWKIHRILWTEANGQIPEGVHILHRCDNRRCAELAHFYPGDNTQNIADKVARDRSGKKLNIAKVKEIKVMLASGLYSQIYIAKLYGVSQGKISMIKTGRNWSHVVVVGGRLMASDAV